MANSAPLRSYIQNRPPVGSDGPLAGCCSSDNVNVGDAERSISIALGGFALGTGLCRGSLGGLLMSLIGSGLLYRGLTGNCPLYQKLEMSTASGQSERRAVSGSEIRFRASEGVDDAPRSTDVARTTGLA